MPEAITTPAVFLRELADELEVITSLPSDTDEETAQCLVRARRAHCALLELTTKMGMALYGAAHRSQTAYLLAQLRKLDAADKERQ